MILSNWREVIIAILSIVCFYLYNKKPLMCPTLVADKQVEKVEQIEKTQKVVTVTTRPDGTKTVKTVTTEKQTQIQEREQVRETVAVVKQDLTRYDVHMARPISYGTSNGEYDYQIGVGARIGNLPAFITVDYRWYTKELMAGVRIEW